MKKCPHCAEDIQDAAKVCRHCQRDVPSVTTTEPEAVRSGRDLLAVPVATKPATSGAVKIVALIVGFFVLLFVLSLFQSDGTPGKTLDVTARTTPSAIEITNAGSGDVAGQELVVYINGSPPFTYKAVSTLPVLGERIRIPLSAFTLKDGTRFNPFATAVTGIWVGGGGYDYRSFKN